MATKKVFTRGPGAGRALVDHEHEHDTQWATTSVAEKIRCTAETLRHWVLRAGVMPGADRG